MKEKKNIDELFKERFKNFEANPSPDVWNKIQSKLKDEDDRKVIPLWIKLGGVAALLALVFTIGSTFFNSPIDPINKSNPIVVEDETTEDNPLETNQNNIKDSKLEKEQIVVSNEEVNKDLNPNIIKSKKDLNDSSRKTKNETIDKSKSIIASNTTSEEKSNTTKKYKIKETEITNSEKERIAQNQIEINENAKESLINKNTEIDSSIEVVTNDKELNNNTDSDLKKSEVEAIKKEDNKRSIFDAINETPNEDVVIANIDNKPDNRWEVTPNVAPVYYNTLSEGSSIDPSFSDNPKSGDLNIAYGVKVSYNLNKRLSIRSGVSNVNLSYSTTGLDIGTGPVSAATSSSIDYQGRNNVTIVVDKGALVNQNPEDPFANVTPKSTNGEPYLNQKLSYFEMPVELNYAIINKKFGINLIGGFSTLLLGNNEVSVEAGDFNEVLGEANNLSSLSFTTNIGLGLNYSFSKKLMFNIEPMFKYQLNPYTDSSVNFKPYYVGIYSGLSFKF